MEWLDRLRESLDYLEQNLAGQVDTARAAQLAGCSVYHYTRMFGYVCGVPLAEYLRRRRLTLAGLELAGGGAKVLDVALRYGYESPTAFTRAFKAMHGVAPAAAKRPGVKLVAYPRISFQISVKGEVEMEYRFENLPAFKIAGYKQATNAENGSNLVDIPRMWADMTEEECLAVVALLDGTPPMELLGVCANMRGSEFDYYIAAPTQKPAPQGMHSLDIPAATWAVFESVGPLPHAIQDVWKRIYSEWFPNSGYEHASMPDFEAYPKGDNSAADYRCEVWIPVVKV